MSEYYGHDYHDAENRFADCAQAVRDLIRVICGDENKHLANAVCNQLFRAEWQFKQAAEKLVAQHQFKTDFGWYLLHKCTSLKEAQQIWIEGNKAYADDRNMRSDIDFEQWQKKIKEAL